MLVPKGAPENALYSDVDLGVTIHLLLCILEDVLEESSRIRLGRCQAETNVAIFSVVDDENMLRLDLGARDERRI